MLHEVRSFAQLSVRFHRQDGHASACVVGDQNMLAAFVHGYEAGVRAARRHRIERGQLAGVTVYGEGADGPALRAVISPDFIGGEQVVQRGIHRQERRAGGLPSQFHRCHLARTRQKAACVDALAVLASVGSEIDQVLFGSLTGARKTRAKRQQGGESHQEGGAIPNG